MFDLSSLRVDPNALPEAALLKPNNGYNNIQLPGKTLNCSNVTVPVSYVPPYAFNQLAQNTRICEDSDYLFTNCHNLYVDEVQGRIYGLGTTRAAPVVVFDIKNDPLHPVFLGASDEFYIHDMANATYNREDALRILGYELPEGQETLTLGIAAAETVYNLIDWTGELDYKTAQFGANTGIFKPRVIASIPTQQLNVSIGYAHNAWWTTDKRYAILGDELVDQNQPYGSLQANSWNCHWVAEPRFNSETGQWTFSSAQHLFGDAVAKVHNSYFVNESQDPFEDWMFTGTYKGGLRIDSFKYKKDENFPEKNFPIDYSMTEGGVRPLSWQDGGPGGPNSNPFIVENKGSVVSDPYEPRTAADAAFEGTWSVTPFTEELDTPASKRLIIFDDGQNLNWGQYEYGNTNTLTPEFNTMNNKIRLLHPTIDRGSSIDGGAQGVDSVRALTTFEAVGAAGYMVSTDDDSLFKSSLYPGFAVNAAPDLDLRVLFLESDYNLEKYKLPNTDEVPVLAAERPAQGDRVFVLGINDEIVEGVVIAPYASEYDKRQRIFQDELSQPSAGDFIQITEFIRKSEMLISIPAAPGFSGKPVFNLKKEIVGFIRDQNVHGDIVGVVASDVIRTMTDKTRASLNSYWVQNVRNDTGSIELSIHDSFTDPLIIANDPKPLCVYKDTANDLVYGFLSTQFTGVGSSLSYFIDPVSIIQSGDGIDPNPLTAIQQMGLIGGPTGTSMNVRGLNPANESIDYPSAINFRFDGFLEPYRLIPLQSYTAGTFTPGEILTGTVTDPNSPAFGEVRSRVLFIKDAGPNLIQVYPIILEDVDSTPFWRIPAGKDTSLFMTTGEALEGAQSGTTALVVNGFAATDADAVSPMPVWSRDDDGVFDPTKALFRRLYAKSSVDFERFISEHANAWYHPEESFFQEKLSWYQENATPVRYFSLKTIDSSQGIVQSVLRAIDRAVIGITASPLDAEFFSESVNANMESQAFTVQGANFVLKFDWSADSRITEKHVMVTGLDLSVEENGLNEPFSYGDIIYGWKLCGEAEFKDFDINTWFAQSAGLPNGSCVQFQVLRYDSDAEKFSDEVVVERTMFDSQQNPLHTL